MPEQVDPPEVSMVLWGVSGVVVSTVEPPGLLVRAVAAMDAFVASCPTDQVVRIETAGAAVQMRHCFDRGVLYPPFPDPGYVLSGPDGLARAMAWLWVAAEHVPSGDQRRHLGQVWRELHDYLPSGWVSRS